MPLRIALFAALVTLSASMAPVSAQEKTESKAVETKRSTYKVVAKPFRIEASLEGVFEAEQVAELSLRPEEWKTLEVVKAVEQGATVKKGQSLVELETSDLDQQIRDLQQTLVSSALSIKEAAEELKRLDIVQSLELEAAERAQKIAAGDLKYFLETGRPMAERSARFSLQNSQYSLDYAREELEQLEKMYKADDLTEETEEIILIRARRQVEMAEFLLQNTKLRTERILTTDLPRQEEQYKETARRQELALLKLRETLPLSRTQKRVQLEKLQMEQEKNQRRLKDLQHDRELLSVRAPIDGIVYYGSFTRGKWSGSATVEKQLRPGGTLTANQVFLTIVQPRPMFVRAEVPEKELHHLKVGLKGKVIPTGRPELRLAAVVKEVSTIPVDAGKFDCRIGVELADEHQFLVPGMSCTAKLVAYEQEKALTIPSSALFSEETDEEARYVYLVKGDSHEKRSVKIGRRSSDEVEILEGLREGDEILKQKPEEQ